MSAVVLPDELFAEIQGVFRKAPVLLVGSGFSCGYGIPGMGDLAEHLADVVGSILTRTDAKEVWAQAISGIRENLEAGLGRIPLAAPGWEEIVSAIRSETARLILESTAAAEVSVLQEKADGSHAPSRLLKRLFEGALQNSEGIHVITTNYDTLLELFCDLAGLPLDTGFTGFRRRKPRPRPMFHNYYNRILVAEKRQQQFDHRLCKTVRLYKPHGSISWLATEEGPVEVLNDASSIGRAIVVPGPSKYQDTLVNTLFDEMRTAMNMALDSAQALFCIGFGFNDDHLQGVIKRRLVAGMPAIIVTRDPTPNIERLLAEHSNVIAVFKDEDGAVFRWNGSVLQYPEPLWQLDEFLRTFVE